MLLKMLSRDHHLGLHFSPFQRVGAPFVPPDTSKRTDFGSKSVCQVFSQAVQLNILQPFVGGVGKNGTGSGWVTEVPSIGQVILTNHHVTNEAQVLKVAFPGYGARQFDVELVSDAPEWDLAMLKMKDQTVALDSLVVGDSDQCVSGSGVMAVGFPLGQRHQKMTTGVVSGHEQLGNSEVLQTDAAINPGNSGGPLISIANHRVLGINSSIIQNTNNVGYAIPANIVKVFMANTVAMKRANPEQVFIKRPVLGAFCQSSTPEQTAYLQNPKEGGYYVNYVLPGSLMAQAGIQKGDQICSVNDKSVDMYGQTSVDWSPTPVNMTRILNRLSLGDNLSLKVFRNGKPVETSLTYEACDPRAVKPLYFPYAKLDYEVFGGFVVEQLAQNHIAGLLGQNPLLASYLLPENLLRHTLVVTHVFPSSKMEHLGSMKAGTVLTRVNNVAVHTLQEYRAAIRAGSKKSYFCFTTDLNRDVVLAKKDIVEEDLRLSKQFNYHPSSLLQSLQLIGQRVQFFRTQRKESLIGEGLVTKLYPSGKTVKVLQDDASVRKIRVHSLTLCSPTNPWEPQGEPDLSDDGEVPKNHSHPAPKTDLRVLQRNLGLESISHEDFVELYNSGGLI